MTGEVVQFPRHHGRPPAEQIEVARTATLTHLIHVMLQQHPELWDTVFTTDALVEVRGLPSFTCHWSEPDQGWKIRARSGPNGGGRRRTADGATS